MKTIFFLSFLWSFACLPIRSYASSSLPSSVEIGETKPSFNGTFYSQEADLYIHLDLDKESLEVPTMEFLGPMHGYMNGGIYGVWMLVKHEFKGDKLLLRFSNDIGADSQTIELTSLGEGEYRYRAVGENLVRKVVGRKLVKIVDTMIMKKVEK